jgi:hypothetical protein
MFPFLHNPPTPLTNNARLNLCLCEALHYAAYTRPHYPMTALSKVLSFVPYLKYQDTSPVLHLRTGLDQGASQYCALVLVFRSKSCSYVLCKPFPGSQCNMQPSEMCLSLSHSYSLCFIAASHSTWLIKHYEMLLIAGAQFAASPAALPVQHQVAAVIAASAACFSK